MELFSLNAISPIDGRYKKTTYPLSNYFSEAALIKYRVKVEVEYFIALVELGLPELSEVKPEIYDNLRSVYFVVEPANSICSLAPPDNGRV